MEVVVSRKFGRSERVVIIITPYIGAYFPFPYKHRAVGCETVEVAVGQVLLNPSVPIIIGVRPLDCQPFDRLQPCIHFGYHAPCLCREFVLVKPLSAVGIEVAYIFILRILYASVKAGYRVI